MKKVYHMTRGTHFIEAPHTEMGRKLLESMRASLPEYRGRHIKEVIQGDPEKIKWGKEYEYGADTEEDTA